VVVATLAMVPEGIDCAWRIKGPASLICFTILAREEGGKRTIPSTCGGGPGASGNKGDGWTLSHVLAKGKKRALHHRTRKEGRRRRGIAH